MPALRLVPGTLLDRQRISDIGRLLRERGFAGTPLGDDGYYTTGDKFLDFVTFVGCSPSLKLDPDGGDRPGSDRFVHLQLLGADLPALQIGNRPRAPLCPSCRKPLAGWRHVGSHGQAHSSGPTVLRCEDCGAVWPPDKVRWRDGAVFTASHLAVLGVYPGEALPTPLLLQLLRHASQCDWYALYL